MFLITYNLSNYKNAQIIQFRAASIIYHWDWDWLVQGVLAFKQNMVFSGEEKNLHEDLA